MGMLNPPDLRDDIAVLKALLVASEDRNLRKQDRIDHLEKLVADVKRALFGVRSEKATPEQYELALEDIETAMAAIHAEDAALDPSASRPAKPRNTNRGSRPKPPLRIGEGITPDVTCDCGAERHLIAEDTSERLDIIKSLELEGAAFDLGPAWFWPGQMRMAQLVERLAWKASSNIRMVCAFFKIPKVSNTKQPLTV